MKYWFLVRDSYDISWLGDYVSNLSSGLMFHGKDVGYITREDIQSGRQEMKSGDVCIVTDFDDMDIVSAIPDGVVKVSHGHGVALSWIANNWSGEIAREMFFYDNMDIVTLNTPSQKELIEKEIVPKCKLSVIGYPMQYSRISEKASMPVPRDRRKRILVAQRWDWDAQQELCMDILEPFVKDSNYDVVVLTPSTTEYAESTVGRDTLDKWSRKCTLIFRCSQEMFWSYAKSSDVFVTTGNHHTLNLSLVEAYLLGCEVVAPKKYPYTDYVTEAFWYKPYDVSEARNCIKKACTKKDTRIDLNRFDCRNVAANLIKAVESL